MLAIDLFCGLVSRQAELLLGADAPVEQLVARRAQNPNHVPLGICDDLPCAVALVIWLVRYLKDSVLSARFARRRNVGVSAPQSPYNAVLKRTVCIVGFNPIRISAHEKSPLCPRGLTRAVLRTIASIGAWWRYSEMLPAPKAISPILRHIGLFKPASAPSAGRAWLAAVSFIWPLGFETCATIRTK
jgi:hypothetical protein